MKVLVVEDHPDISLLYSRMLSQCDIINVDSGSQAIEKLSDEQYDMLIVDMHLGAVSGLDVLSHVQTQQRNEKMVVLAISADDSLKKQAKEYGTDFWMTKPINIDRLFTYLSSIRTENQNGRNEGE